MKKKIAQRSLVSGERRKDRIFLIIGFVMSLAACQEPSKPATASLPQPTKSEGEMLDDEIIRNPEPHIAAALAKAPHVQEGELSVKVAKITYQGPGQVIVGATNMPSYIVKVPTWIVEAESDKGRHFTVEYTVQPGTPADRRGAARLSEQMKR